MPPVKTPLAVHVLASGIVAVLPAPESGACAASPELAVRAEVQGRQIVGRPLYWSKSEVQLLGRDGRLHSFRPADARRLDNTTDRFRPFSPGEMRAQLRQELGPDFVVVGTGRYLVAFPRGQRNHWAQRFEDLYRSFVHYWNVRGLKTSQPEFPLVAVVWPTREEFLHYARHEGANITGNVLGYYSPITNRISLFDVTRGNPDDPNWSLNAQTIIHEATHQTAYNTGIHPRFGNHPKWLIEGLATMFEAPGVWNSRYHDSQKDRINHGRLAQFKQYVAGRRKPGSLARLVESDRVFQSDVDAGYAEAWALTFYLVETQPRKFSEYLQLLAARQLGEPYSAAQRKADFEKVFGEALAMTEARFLRFMERIK